MKIALKTELQSQNYSRQKCPYLRQLSDHFEEKRIRNSTPGPQITTKELWETTQVKQQVTEELCFENVPTSFQLDTETLCLWVFICVEEKRVCKDFQKEKVSEVFSY